MMWMIQKANRSLIPCYRLFELWKSLYYYFMSLYLKFIAEQSEHLESLQKAYSRQLTLLA